MELKSPITAEYFSMFDDYSVSNQFKSRINKSNNYDSGFHTYDEATYLTDHVTTKDKSFEASQSAVENTNNSNQTESLPGKNLPVIKWNDEKYLMYNCEGNSFHSKYEKTDGLPNISFVDKAVTSFTCTTMPVLNHTNSIISSHAVCDASNFTERESPANQNQNHSWRSTNAPSQCVPQQKYESPPIQKKSMNPDEDKRILISRLHQQKQHRQQNLVRYHYRVQEEKALWHHGNVNKIPYHHESLHTSIHQPSENEFHHHPHKAYIHSQQGTVCNYQQLCQKPCVQQQQTTYLIKSPVHHPIDPCKFDLYEGTYNGSDEEKDINYISQQRSYEVIPDPHFGKPNYTATINRQFYHDPVNSRTLHYRSSNSTHPVTAVPVLSHPIFVFPTYPAGICVRNVNHDVSRNNTDSSNILLTTPISGTYPINPNTHLPHNVNLVNQTSQLPGRKNLLPAVKNEQQHVSAVPPFHPESLDVTSKEYSLSTCMPYIPAIESNNLQKNLENTTQSSSCLVVEKCDKSTEPDKKLDKENCEQVHTFHVDVPSSTTNTQNKLKPSYLCLGKGMIGLHKDEVEGGIESVRKTCKLRRQFQHFEQDSFTEEPLYFKCEKCGISDDDHSCIHIERKRIMIPNPQSKHLMSLRKRSCGESKSSFEILEKYNISPNSGDINNNKLFNTDDPLSEFALQTTINSAILQTSTPIKLSDHLSAEESLLESFSHGGLTDCPSPITLPAEFWQYKSDHVDTAKKNKKHRQQKKVKIESKKVEFDNMKPNILQRKRHINKSMNHEIKVLRDSIRDKRSAGRTNIKKKKTLLVDNVTDVKMQLLCGIGQDFDDSVGNIILGSHDSHKILAVSKRKLKKKQMNLKFDVKLKSDVEVADTNRALKPDRGKRKVRKSQAGIVISDNISKGKKHIKNERHTSYVSNDDDVPLALVKKQLIEHSATDTSFDDRVLQDIDVDELLQIIFIPSCHSSFKMQKSNLMAEAIKPAVKTEEQTINRHDNKITMEHTKLYIQDASLVEETESHLNVNSLDKYNVPELISDGYVNAVSISPTSSTCSPLKAIASHSCVGVSYVDDKVSDVEKFQSVYCGKENKKFKKCNRKKYLYQNIMCGHSTNQSKYLLFKNRSRHRLGSDGSTSYLRPVIQSRRKKRLGFLLKMKEK